MVNAFISPCQTNHLQGLKTAIYIPEHTSIQPPKIQTAFHPKSPFYVETEIYKLVNKGGYIQNITFKNEKKAQVKAIYARLPFVSHSSTPEALSCELTLEGYIKIDPAHRTTVQGVYACGDNTKRMRTVANALAMGTTTGIMVNKEIIVEDF